MQFIRLHIKPFPPAGTCAYLKHAQQNKMTEKLETISNSFTQSQIILVPDLKCYTDMVLINLFSVFTPKTLHSPSKIPSWKDKYVFIVK